MRRISLLQLKVSVCVSVCVCVGSGAENKVLRGSFNRQTTWLLSKHSSSWFVDVFWALRAKGGDGKWLLADDLGAEHSDHCHGDQPEGEKGGKRRANVDVYLLYAVVDNIIQELLRTSVLQQSSKLVVRIRSSFLVTDWILFFGYFSA